MTPSQTGLLTPIAVALAFALALPAPAADTPPAPYSQPQPLYPYAMKQKNIEGVVVVAFGIGADGRVSRAWAIAYSNVAFAANAVAAVESWRFRPATVDGRPVASPDLKVPLLFSLNPSPNAALSNELPAIEDSMGKLELGLDHMFRSYVERTTGKTPLSSQGGPGDRIWFRLALKDGLLEVGLVDPSATAESVQMRDYLQRAFTARPLPAPFLTALEIWHEVSVSALSTHYLTGSAPAAAK